MRHCLSIDPPNRFVQQIVLVKSTRVKGSFDFVGLLSSRGGPPGLDAAVEYVPAMRRDTLALPIRFGMLDLDGR